MLKVLDTTTETEETPATPTLDDLAREGARRMLMAALQVEVAQDVDAYQEARDASGRRLVVRHGQAEARKVTCGAGTVEVRAPRVNDKRIDATGQREVPADRDGHVIMDHDGTHKPAVIRRWVARPPRVHPHCTPTYAAWLHRVERWFASREMQPLRRGVPDSVRSRASAMRAFIAASHTAGQPDVWTNPADDLLARIARVALRTGTVHDRQQVMSRPTGTGH